MTSIGLTLPFMRAGSGLGHAAHMLWVRWRNARLLAETRRSLRDMDEHMLQDLGVSRAQLNFELDEQARWVHR
jgi:uncharacterized protein YjiS (DUF1127 family)